MEKELTFTATSLCCKTFSSIRRKNIPSTSNNPSISNIRFSNIRHVTAQKLESRESNKFTLFTDFSPKLSKSLTFFRAPEVEYFELQGLS